MASHDDGDDVSIHCCGTRRARDDNKIHMVGDVSSTSTFVGRDIFRWSCGLQVSPYICDGYAGTVRMVLPTDFREFDISWNLPKSAQIREQGRFVDNLRPGKYSTVVRCQGVTQRLSVEVHRLEASIIVGYVSRPNTLFPWNGEVEAQVQNCPPDARFLWSNGIVTQRPLLTCCRPGTYTTTIIHAMPTVVVAREAAVVENLMQLE